MFCAFFSSVSYNLNAICIFSFIAATIEILARYMECYAAIYPHALFLVVAKLFMDIDNAEGLH